MRWIAGRTLLVVLGLLMGVAAPAWAGAKAFEVKVDQAQTLLRERSGKQDFNILDVRTPGEFAEGRLAGAVNVDLQSSDFEKQLSALDKSKTYLVYCRTGNRSRRAIQTMERLGFGSIYHMYEGVVGWQLKGYPLTKK
jgi:phage shock protein E